jgi:uncharacterized membrane protein YhaH (DUF805 family)
MAFSEIIFNSSNKTRPFWRLMLFLIIAFAINIPLQLGLQQILDQSNLRGFFSASIYFIAVVCSLFIQIKSLERSSFNK